MLKTINLICICPEPEKTIIPTSPGSKQILRRDFVFCEAVRGYAIRLSDFWKKTGQIMPNYAMPPFVSKSEASFIQTNPY